jgi:hypothetical protein
MVSNAFKTVVREHEVEKSSSLHEGKARKRERLKEKNNIQQGLTPSKSHLLSFFHLPIAHQ